MKKNNSLAFCFMLIGTICFFANNHILTVAIPLLINDRGLGLDVIGYCTAGMGLMTILTKFFTPALTQKIKIKTLLILDLFLLTIISAGFLFFDSSTSIIIIRALFGIPFSIFPILNLLALSCISPNKEDLIKYTSLIGTAMPFSMMVSPAVTEILLDNFSYGFVFKIAAFFALMSLCLYFAGLNITENSKDSKPQKPSSVNTANELRTFLTIGNFGKYFPILLGVFFLGIADIIVLTYFPVIAASDSKTYSFYFIVFSLTMILSQKLYYSFRISRTKLLILGYMGLGISIVLISFCSYSFFLFAIMSSVLFGIGYSLTETTSNIIMLLNEKHSALLITITQLAGSLGRTFAPWAASFFSGGIQSLKIFFVIIAIFSIVPIVLTEFSPDRKNP